MPSISIKIFFGFKTAIMPVLLGRDWDKSHNAITNADIEIQWYERLKLQGRSNGFHISIGLILYLKYIGYICVCNSY